jgi:hypothetical protein
MIKATRDPRGDVWHHSRNVLIQAVSKKKLQEFMEGFNDIVTQAFIADKAEDNFYQERGVLVHSMEVTGYQCVDTATSEVLQEVIRETTNRMNRLQQQVSENEVKEAELAAKIDLEVQRTELLTTQASNERLVSAMAGEASGLKLAKSAQTFLTALAENATLPDVADRLELYRLHQELQSKDETTKNLASGSAMLFVTPEDVNLNLNNPEL